MPLRVIVHHSMPPFKRPFEIDRVQPNWTTSYWAIEKKCLLSLNWNFRKYYSCLSSYRYSHRLYRTKLDFLTNIDRTKSLKICTNFHSSVLTLRKEFSQASLMIICLKLIKTTREIFNENSCFVHKFLRGTCITMVLQKILNNRWNNTSGNMSVCDARETGCSFLLSSLWTRDEPFWRRVSLFTTLPLF